MQTVIITRGTPASGKSTFCKELMEQEPGKWKRINNDSLRLAFDFGVWLKENEKLVKETRSYLLKSFLNAGYNVLIDNVNANKAHTSEVIKVVSKLNLDVEVIEKPFYIDLETAIERDSKREGFVLVDKDFNRVKIKASCYIAAHGLISSLAASDRNIMRLILEDKADDLSFIKDNLITERVELFKNKLSDLLKLIHLQYLANKEIQSDKEFALVIKDLPYKAVLFALRKNKYNSVVEYFRNKTCNSAIDNLIGLCEVENRKD